jgi:ArsR family transcriptional regulator
MNIPFYDHDARLAAGLAALAHPARLRILRTLSQSPACCCKDVVGRLDLAQSTVSQHLKVLTDCGLVAYAPDRQRSRYSLDRAALGALSDALASLSAECTGPAGDSENNHGA